MMLPDLPAHTHGTVLRAVSAATGTKYAHVVVWADRTAAECPRCQQPVPLDPGCPVALGQGEVQDLDQQHGCGEWLEAEYRTLAVRQDTPAPQDITAAAEELAGQREERMDDAALACTRHLRKELHEALTRWNAPLHDGESLEDREDEVRTGNEITPGVYREGGKWIAWDHDPRGGNEPLTVTEDEIHALQC